MVLHVTKIITVRICKAKTKWYNQSTPLKFTIKLENLQFIYTLIINKTLLCYLIYV